jgi:hypothetical protein
VDGSQGPAIQKELGQYRGLVNKVFWSQFPHLLRGKKSIELYDRNKVMNCLPSIDHKNQGIYKGMVTRQKFTKMPKSVDLAEDRLPQLIESS